jgi:hypothetical protein
LRIANLEQSASRKKGVLARAHAPTLAGPCETSLITRIRVLKVIATEFGDFPH